jgi:hypothetical protein
MAQHIMTLKQQAAIDRYCLWNAFLIIDESSKVLPAEARVALWDIVSANGDAVRIQSPLPTAEVSGIRLDDATKRVIAYSHENAERSGQSEVTMAALLKGLLLEERSIADSPFTAIGERYL